MARHILIIHQIIPATLTPLSTMSPPGPVDEFEYFYFSNHDHNSVRASIINKI